MEDWTVQPLVEIQTPATDTTVVVQPQATPEQLAQIEADKLSLQSEYTKTRQALIEYAVKVATDDPSSIHWIKDIKLRDSVVKNLYEFDNYAQAVAILGSDFNAVKDGNDSIDKTEKLEREVKILKYKSEQSIVENEIKNYKLANPQYFTNTENEEKLRAELQYISWELPIAERIKRASAIAFVPSVDPTTAAYQVLNSWVQGTLGNGKVNSETAQLAEQQKQIAAWRKVFGLK